MSNYTITKTGEPVTVVGAHLGWIAVQKADGTQIKVRNSWLSVDGQPQGSMDMRKQTPKQAKTTKAPTKAVKKVAAKAKAAKANGTRVAAPAHEIKEAKVGVIGETQFSLKGYFVGDTRTASGRRTIDTNDSVAEKLRGMELKAVYDEAAKHCDVSRAALVKQYEHLNPGMQRMNLGNRIRGALSRKASEKAAKASAKA